MAFIRRPYSHSYHFQLLTVTGALLFNTGPLRCSDGGSGRGWTRPQAESSQLCVLVGGGVDGLNLKHAGGTPSII